MCQYMWVLDGVSQYIWVLAMKKELERICGAFLPRPEERMVVPLVFLSRYFENHLPL